MHEQVIIQLSGCSDYEEAKKIIERVCESLEFASLTDNFLFILKYDDDRLKNILKVNNFSDFESFRLYIELLNSSSSDYQEKIEEIFNLTNLLENQIDDYSNEFSKEFHFKDLTFAEELKLVDISFKEEWIAIKYSVHFSLGVWDYADLDRLYTGIEKPLLDNDIVSSQDDAYFFLMNGEDFYGENIEFFDYLKTCDNSITKSDVFIYRIHYNKDTDMCEFIEREDFISFFDLLEEVQSSKNRDSYFFTIDYHI